MKNNEALMTRARRLNPVRAEAFRNLAHSPEGRETLDAILQSNPPVRSTGGSSQRAFPRSLDNGAPRTTIGLRVMGKRAASIVTAAAIVLGIVIVGTSDRAERSEDTAWSAELVRIAEKSPRLLISQEGWKVTGADEFSGQTGEMSFENGQYWMALNWYAADMHADYVKDRKRGADASWEITIAGHEAIIFQHKGTAPIGTTFYAQWRDGEHSMELRSDVIPTIDEFRAVAATLHVVDVDTWLSAMPANVVRPNGREGVIDKLLADVPIPTNVDIEELKKSVTVMTGPSMEYEVTTVIVCGWVQQWIDGTKTANSAAVSEAVNAMAGSHQWAVMKRIGGASYIFEVANAMATKSRINGDRSVPIGVGYQRHLGCSE